MSNPETLIIGIGNEYRGDDAAGLLAARKIKEIFFRQISALLKIMVMALI